MRNQTSRPLPELLSDALLTLTRHYEEAGAGDDPPPSLAMWSGLLRALRPSGITMRELVREARVSKRAVASWLGTAARWGYLVPERAGPARMGDRMDVTDKWRAVAAEWPDVERAAAKSWAKQVGAPAAKELRAVLEGLVGRFDLELPHYPVPYGPADWSLTGGRHRPAQPGPPRVPASGADWTGVGRGEGEVVDRARAALEAVSPKLDPPSDPPHHVWVQWEPAHAFVEATQQKRP